MANIIFTKILDIDDSFKPIPAKNVIPEWYKNTSSYFNDEKMPFDNGETSATIKRCMPVFDALTAGYIIVTYTDIYVSRKDDMPWYTWPSSNPINFHPINQALDHPNFNGFPYPKFMNAYGITTPKGWSSLIMQPVHRELPFNILPGIVDTDYYNLPVNFPMVLTDINFEGLVPAGTPIAQIVPIKRQKWTMELGNKEIKDKTFEQFTKLHARFFDNYKNLWRQKKEYL